MNYLHKIDEVEATKTKGLVIVITESVATDVYRERKRKRKSTILFEDMELSMPKLKSNTVEENLAIAITLLPERYKTIVLLRYRHGYSYETSFFDAVFLCRRK